EAGVATAARCGDRGEQTAGLRIDLLDRILGDLKQVLTVEGRSGMGCDIDRAQCLPARRIKRDQSVSSSKPALFAVIGEPIDAVDTRKGSILTDDFGR